MNEVLIAPSILSADFSRLGDEVRRVDAAGADWIHVDVMDGHFVPNLTMGPDVVAAIRKVTKLPLDVHLMVEDPASWAEDFAEAGADRMTFHIEAMVPEASRRRVERGWTLDEGRYDAAAAVALGRETAARIRALGKKAGLSLNPDTAASAVLPLVASVDLVLVMTVWPGFGGQEFIESAAPKIAAVRRASAAVRVEVDGGLNPSTAGRAAAAGADVIVAGTAVFRAKDAALAIKDLRDAAKAAAR